MYVATSASFPVRFSGFHLRIQGTGSNVLQIKWTNLVTKHVENMCSKLVQFTWSTIKFDKGGL